MKLNWLISISFVLFLSSAQAQIPLQSFTEIEARLAQGKDTCYVVNFWATWCKPCVHELPYFDSLQAQYPEIKVLLVSLDFVSKHDQVLIPFVAKKGIQSQVIHLNETEASSIINRVSSEWSGAIPATFIQQGSKPRKFYEQEFTYSSLENAYLTYISK
jgi:thiol-disulfide isomerase/thioredoxin